MKACALFGSFLIKVNNNCKASACCFSVDWSSTTYNNSTAKLEHIAHIVLLACLAKRTTYSGICRIMLVCTLANMKRNTPMPPISLMAALKPFCDFGAMSVNSRAGTLVGWCIFGLNVLLTEEVLNGFFNPVFSGLNGDG